MLNKIKLELEKYNEAYKSGEMMSMNESIEAEIYCDMFLKKIDEIEKLNISEEAKVNMLREYAQDVYATGIANNDIAYKYNMDDMLGAINQSFAKSK